MYVPKFTKCVLNCHLHMNAMDRIAADVHKKICRIFFKKSSAGMNAMCGSIKTKNFKIFFLSMV